MVGTSPLCDFQRLSQKSRRSTSRECQTTANGKEYFSAALCNDFFETPHQMILGYFGSVNFFLHNTFEGDLTSKSLKNIALALAFSPANVLAAGTRMCCPICNRTPPIFQSITSDVGLLPMLWTCRIGKLLCMSYISACDGRKVKTPGTFSGVIKNLGKATVRNIG